VNPSAVRAFADRDWRRIQEDKERYWAERRQDMTPAEALQIADELRQWVRALRPDWPSEEERREDLAHHTYLAKALGRVPRSTES
jgi:hypothetical protein